MHLREQFLSGVLVVTPQEQRLDASVAGAFRDKLGDFILQGHDRMVLDLEQVHFMDSSGLTALISTLKSLGGQGGQMVVSGVGPNLSSLFHLTRLDKIFRVYASVEEASRALGDAG